MLTSTKPSLKYFELEQGWQALQANNERRTISGMEGSFLILLDSSAFPIKYRDELALIIDYSFKNSEDVYFCLTVPFTYSDNEQYLFDLKKFIHPNILYQD